MSRKRMAAALALALVGALASCSGPKVKTIEPGLTCLDKVEGKGAVVATNDIVVVNATGWLWENGAKGRQISSANGDTIAIRVGSKTTIAGLEKGVLGMRIGGTRDLTLAPQHAFREQGRPPVIPANATIFFEVTALEKARLEVQVLQEGTGEAAARGRQVAVHYTGFLWVNNATGAKFDSSLDRGEPIRFRLGAGQVIPGWDAAFEGMKVGTKARIIVPAILAYGRMSPPGSNIPPNSDLAFDVELVGAESNVGGR